MNKSNLRESALLQLQEVQRHIVFVEEKLKNVRNEKIWCYRHGKNFQYCTNTKDPATGAGKRCYIAKAKIAGLKNVFQNEYYFKILPHLQKNLKALMDFVKQYDDLQLIQAYEKMPPAKKIYVTPFIYDDKSFAANCGMMTSRDYANDFVQRLSQYSQNNIFPGKNLLITTESDIHPLNTRDVERLIKSFLT